MNKMCFQENLEMLESSLLLSTMLLPHKKEISLSHFSLWLFSLGIQFS